MGPTRGGWGIWEGGSQGAQPGPGLILQSLQPNAHNMGPGCQTCKHTIHQLWPYQALEDQSGVLPDGPWANLATQLTDLATQLTLTTMACDERDRFVPDPPRCQCFKTPAHTLPVTFPFVLLWSIVVSLLKAHIKQHGLVHSTNNIWQNYNNLLISETCSRLQQALQNNINKQITISGSIKLV